MGIEKDVALAEITDTIRGAMREKRLKRVSIEQIQIIAATYQVNLHRQFHEALAGLYSDYLRHCLEDKVISEAEAENLAHLKLILGLNDMTVDRIHSEVVNEVYRASVTEVIADGRLDPEEQAFLEKLEYDLRLPEDIAGRIFANEAKEYLDRFYHFAVADERLSPEEERELNAIAQSLGVDIRLDEHTQSALNKYRLYWVIENGTLPELDTGFPLERGEKCLLMVELEWYEPVHETLAERLGHVRFFRSSYQHPTDLDVHPLEDDHWRRIDGGQAYLTDRRVILKGEHTQAEMALERIMDVKTFRNGIELLVRSGTSPFLAFETGVDIFLVLLGRALRDLD